MSMADTSENLLKMAEQKCQSAIEKIAKDLIANSFIQPQTNADRIRAMSDMELRDFLQSRVWLCETHKLCDGCPLYSEEKGCLSTLEWLQQPAEE